MTAGVLRVLLIVCLVAMFVLAMLSLRRRRLTLAQFIAWTILALFLPALGPFLVLLLRPGEPLQRFSPPGQ
jgi:hypothetical protein